MADFTYDDLQSAISGSPNEHMITQGMAMGADPFPKRAIGDMSGMASQASIPPWLLPFLLAAGFKGRGGSATPNRAAIPRPITPARPAPSSSVVGNIVRQHFGQDNVNPTTNRQGYPPSPLERRLGITERREAPPPGELRQMSYFDSATPQTFPGFRTSGQQASSPNMRAQSFIPLVEDINSGFDRLAGRRVMTPANRTPGQSYNLAAMLQALRNKPGGN